MFANQSWGEGRGGKSFFRYYQGKFSLYQYQWEGWLKMTAFRSRTACHITLETLERWPHRHHQFFCWTVQHILWTWAYLLTTKVITNYFKCAYKYNVKIKVIALNQAPEAHCSTYTWRFLIIFDIFCGYMLCVVIQLPFPVIGSLNGVCMFANNQDVTLLNTVTDDAKVVWKVFNERCFIIQFYLFLLK